MSSPSTSGLGEENFPQVDGLQEALNAPLMARRLQLILLVHDVRIVDSELLPETSRNQLPSRVLKEVPQDLAVLRGQLVVQQARPLLEVLQAVPVAAIVH